MSLLSKLFGGKKNAANTKHYLISELLAAAERGDNSTINKLLGDNEDYAFINGTSSTGMTALMLASKIGLEDTVNNLIDRGADVDLVDINGETALFKASESGCEGIVRLLLEVHADPNITAEDGNTALIWAASHASASLSQVLIAHGAAVNANGHGCTALMMASALGHIEVVKTLLEAGAAVELRPGPGILLSAIDEARKHNRNDIIAILDEASVKQDAAIKAVANDVVSRPRIIFDGLMPSKGHDLEKDKLRIGQALDKAINRSPYRRNILDVGAINVINAGSQFTLAVDFRGSSETIAAFQDSVDLVFKEFGLR